MTCSMNSASGGTPSGPASESRYGLASGGAGVHVLAEVAHAKGVPVLVDAAAQLPPTRNLRRFLEEGADLVSISGGKAILGPQGVGGCVKARLNGEQRYARAAITGEDDDSERGVSV